ncbi:MAG: relaxase domain-containing protein [Acidimicrobiales bacterium]
MTARLGVRWGVIDRDGAGEVLGVPEALLHAWSKRREEVRARGAELVAKREEALGRCPIWSWTRAARRSRR